MSGPEPKDLFPMQRREVLALLATAAIAPLLTALPLEARARVGGRLHERLAAQGTRAASAASTHGKLVSALADTILPRTDSPGAIDVGVPAFIELLLAEWYPDAERQTLLAGLEALDSRCRNEQRAPFAALDATARARFLEGIDGREGKEGSIEAAYTQLKKAIVFGYLTSPAIGPDHKTFPIIPGRFDGCLHVTPERSA